LPPIGLQLRKHRVDVEVVLLFSVGSNSGSFRGLRQLRIRAGLRLSG
jgi:hypothetical protein